MTTNTYMTGRKKYTRPQAILWADNPGYVVDGFHIPDGIEIGNDSVSSGGGNFLILSDDNRQALDFTIERIEKRERMINGRMRSYHIADKLSLSVNWDMLPSRSFLTYPSFDENGKPQFDQTVDAETGKPIRSSGSAFYKDQQFTTDGGAGGVEILDWYEQNQGPFWVYLSYDKYSNYGRSAGAFDGNLPKYSQVIEMYFADFSYSVQKRGGTNYDFWNISLKLEEV